MKKNLTTSVLRFLGLLAVLPLLVAHGIGGQTCTSNCDKPDPFILSGSADPSSAINMGDEVNSEKGDTFASVTPDGKYMLFNRKVDDKGDDVDIYWVDAKIIESLRPKS